MPLTPLPTPPSRSDSANFATRADAFLGAIPTLQAEINALIPTIEQAADAGATASGAAASAAGYAAAAALSAAQAAAIGAGSPGSYPTRNPSFLADFANTRTLDPRLVFQRGSVARVVGPSGRLETVAANVPRFLHDAATGECKGLLMEPSRTNMALQSEDFSAAAWTRVGLLAFGSGSTANAVTAPDGATTADLLTESTAASGHYDSQTISVNAGEAWTISRYLRRTTGRTVGQLWVDTTLLSTGQGFANFDLVAGTVSRVGTGVSAYIEAASDGFWRCSLTVTVDRTATGAVGMAICNSGTADWRPSYTGDGVSGLYCWGAQHELSAWATSYIPTAAATAGRSAEVCYLAGSSAAGLVGAQRGAFLLDAEWPEVASGSSNAVGASVGDGSGEGEKVQIRRSGTGTISCIGFVGGVSQVSITAGVTVSARQRFAAAVSYAPDDVRIAANGQQSGSSTDTSAVIPNCTGFYLGTAYAAAHGGGLVRRVAVWTAPLTNAELIGLTAI